MHVAVSMSMRFVRKLLGLGLLAAGVVYLRGRRRALRATRGVDATPRGVDAGPGGVDAGSGGVDAGPRGRDAEPDDNTGASTAGAHDLADVATESGIADVDPEPLSHVAGEGIDPVRDVEAHEDVAALRERLPRE